MTQLSGLEEIRAEWEKNLLECAKYGDDSLCYVLLRDEDAKFHCHRYFTLGDEWNCSTDHRDVTDSLVALNWFYKSIARLDVFYHHPLPWAVQHDRICEDWKKPKIVDRDGNFVLIPPENIRHPDQFDPQENAIANLIATLIVILVNMPIKRE